MPSKGPASSNGGGPSRVIDLDAARAARAEADEQAVTLRFKGEDFDLPVEMPADFALLANEDRLRDAISALLGDQATRFFELGPSLPDIEVLAEQATVVYGVGEGK